ncbi:hypothetical protein Rhe02_78560 [Rhizocola hellebori]|uniref:IS30 family transposase n=1 Tax=Rhizocola hellebori TaxID=1392758 RepID=A0A8J3VJV4_9ACTN|nr:IS30 family transposase [Rhizocola hellebori]GIH09789.1 hypothetical protein Rhe02_78560 [Rhizocola hellebori]
MLVVFGSLETRRKPNQTETSRAQQARLATSYGQGNKADHGCLPHGDLPRYLSRRLRTGRQLRRPRRQTGLRRNRIAGMVSIRQRPAEGTDRATLGHWEGDLIIGRNNTSAIGTLVERSTGWTMLVPLPHGYKADQIRQPLNDQLLRLPAQLRRSLTRDQGPQMRDWKDIAAATGIDTFSAIHIHHGS